MDVAVDVYVAVPLLFTVLALIIASLYMRSRAPAASTGEQAAAAKVDQSGSAGEETAAEAAAAAAGEAGGEVKAEPPATPAAASQEESGKSKGKPPVEEIGAGEGEPQKQEATANKEKEAEERIPQEHESQPEPGQPQDKLQKEGDEAKIESTKNSISDEGTDDLVDEYRPGKIRGSNYEKTLTREELEEEQRVELTPDFTSV